GPGQGARAAEAAPLVQGGGGDPAWGREPRRAAQLGIVGRHDGLPASELPRPGVRADREALRTYLVGPRGPAAAELIDRKNAWASTRSGGRCSSSRRCWWRRSSCSPSSGSSPATRRWLSWPAV